MKTAAIDMMDSVRCPKKSLVAYFFRMHIKRLPDEKIIRKSFFREILQIVLRC